MSSTNNNGTQSRVFEYKGALKSEEFNRVFSKTLPTGIYDGGNLVRLSATSLSIEPISVVIATVDSDDDIAVRIRTTKDYIPEDLKFESGSSTSLDTSKPLIVARYAWANIVSNYLDFVQVSETLDETHTNVDNLWPNDLIIGKILFVANGVNNEIASVNSFDTTRKSWSTIYRDILLGSQFRVTTSIEAGHENQIYIPGGTVSTRTGSVIVTGGYFPVGGLTATGTTGRNDYVYIDSLGAVKFQLGEPSSVPVTKPYYGRKVIAEIRRSSGRSTIAGSELIPIIDQVSAEVHAEGILITDTYPDGTKMADTDLASYYIATSDGFRTLNSVLNQIGATLVDRTGRIITLETTYVTKATPQFVTGVKTFNTLPKLLSADTVPVPLVPSEASHPITVQYYQNTTTGTGAVQVGTAVSPSAQTLFGVKTFRHMGLFLNADNSVLEVSLPGHPVTKAHFDAKAVTLADTQIVTGAKTFRNTSGVRFEQADLNDAIVVKPRAGGTTSKKITVTNVDALTVDRSVTLPDADVVLVGGTMVPTSRKIAGMALSADISLADLTVGTTESVSSIGLKNVVPAAVTTYNGSSARVLTMFKPDQNLSTVSAPQFVRLGLGTAAEGAGGFDQKMLNGTFKSAVAVNGTGFTMDTVSAVTTLLSLKLAGVEKLNISSAGRLNGVGLGTASGQFTATDGTRTLTVKANSTIDQDLQKSANVEFLSCNVTSSSKKKHNIEPLKISALDMLDEIEIVEFSYNADPTEYRHIGFIAEDTPELLTGPGRDKMALGDCVGFLLQTVKELKEEIRRLKEAR